MSEFNKKFEFKGIPLNEMSYARRTLMLSIMGDSDMAKMVKMHCCLFALVCEVPTAKAAFCNIGAFVEKAMEWAEKNVTEADIEAEGLLIKEVNDHATKTKVEPVEDPNYQSDPSN